VMRMQYVENTTTVHHRITTTMVLHLWEQRFGLEGD